MIRAYERQGENDVCIVGLGNPGREYAKTRHNVGFMTIDKIAERLNISVNKKGFRSVYGEGRLGGTRVVLAKPETFMNNSGWAVGDLLKWYKPQHDELIVIYDDIDLPCGALRIRMNGSAGTHNGMRSIESLNGFEDIPRITVGIGKPAHGLIDHVLGVPNDEEAKLIATIATKIYINLFIPILLLKIIHGDMTEVTSCHTSTKRINYLVKNAVVTGLPNQAS